MRRFSLTHTPRKSLGVKAMMNKSMTIEDNKSGRNVRDKEFQTECIQNVTNFLVSNKFEGNIALSSPSTKDFQNILRFIVAFVDANTSSKFEEDAIFLLKTFKYPYVNEITKSQLTSVTPHALPALISMLSWLTDAIKEADDMHRQKSLDEEFLEHVRREYGNFMENEEVDTNDDDFLDIVREMHENENDELEKLQTEIALAENTLNLLKVDYEEVEKLEKKKAKIMDEINAMIEQGDQIVTKEEKYKQNIEAIYENVKSIQKKINGLVTEKTRLNNIVSDQEINMEDINKLTDEKQLLNKKLDKLKVERETKSKAIANTDSQISHAINKINVLINECCSIRKMSQSEFSMDITEHENVVNAKKQQLNELEITLNVLEEKLHEVKTSNEDIEKEYVRHENKLKDASQMYLYKKEQFDKNYEDGLNKMDQQANDMLKLKLSSDFALQNSERELNNMKIEYDTLKTRIITESDIIEKTLVDLLNFVETNEKYLYEIENDLHKIMN